MEKDFDRNRIAGSLKYGIAAGSHKTLLIAAIVFVAVISFCAVFGIALLAVFTADGTVNWGVCVVGILAICFIMALILFWFVRYVRKANSIKQEMELWLEDAVMLKAYSRNVGGNGDGFVDSVLDALGSNENSGYVIRIGFKYNGNHIKLTSRRENCWGNYLDKEIDILYSPKYREVILLKPE